MAQFRYKLLNGGGVMLMKRWFGLLWLDHENFDNEIHKHERKLQDLHEEMVAANDKRLAAERKKKQIVDDIRKATGQPSGLGTPFTGAMFTGFCKPDVPKPPADWRVWLKGQKGTHKCSPQSETYTLASAGIPSGVQAVEIPQADMRRLEREVNQVSRSNNNGNKQRNN